MPRLTTQPPLTKQEKNIRIYFCGLGSPMNVISFFKNKHPIDSIEMVEWF